MLFGIKPNLFECRGAVTVIEFTRIILEEIKHNLKDVIGKRCTIYPSTRFKGPSFSLPEEGLHLISCSDDVAWKKDLKDLAQKAILKAPSISPISSAD